MLPSESMVTAFHLLENRDRPAWTSESVDEIGAQSVQHVWRHTLLSQSMHGAKPSRKALERRVTDC